MYRFPGLLRSFSNSTIHLLAKLVGHSGQVLDRHPSGADQIRSSLVLFGEQRRIAHESFEHFAQSMLSRLFEFRAIEDGDKLERTKIAPVLF